MVVTAKQEIFNTVNSLLIENFNDILKIEEKALKEGSFNDLSITEMHTIETIGMYNPKMMSEVAKMLEITVGTLTVAVNNLVKKGYAERHKVNSDRRIVKVGLTSKGRLAYRIHEKFHKDMVRASIEGISEEDEAVLAQTLKRLNDFLKEKYMIDKGEK